MEYLIHLAILIGIFAILAVSLNLVVGYTGLLSIAHAVFFGLGAYATAILTTKLQADFFLSALVGMALGALLAFGFGLVLSKFRGDYYALTTMGFNVIVFSLMLNWADLTRGALGIPGIPRPEVFGAKLIPNAWYLALVIVGFALVFTLCRALVATSFGRALKAVRENETVLEVFGYRALAYKLTVFVIAAAMAAFGGSLFASYVQFIDPYNFVLMESVFLMVMVILGGLANLSGSVIGAAFLVILPEVLRFVGFSPDVAAHLRQVVYGLLLILLMLFRPQGLVGEYKL